MFDISLAMSALKETASMLKLFNEAKNQAEVDRAVYEMSSKLSGIQLEYLSLIEELTISKSNETALKAKIAEIENFKSQSEDCEPCQLITGTIVYARQCNTSSGKITMYFCPECFAKRAISILQPFPVEEGDKYTKSQCPSCKNVYLMDYNFENDL
ncbi:hypothetical protein XZ88_002461 [Salmonella enterica subsp. enterica]|nr:hypothetical protein [Salmonella enterica subsp. enterica]EHA9278165.1 hypothetical protein [Salmonella enterica subsp. enterica serovar Shubra]EKA4560286.1 hypothetical protein [Salmonella enterica]